MAGEREFETGRGMLKSPCTNGWRQELVLVQERLGTANWFARGTLNQCAICLRPAKLLTAMRQSMRRAEAVAISIKPDFQSSAQGPMPSLSCNDSAATTSMCRSARRFTQAFLMRAEN